MPLPTQPAALPTLAGNAPLAARLRAAATRGTLASALIISGRGDRLSAALFAACAMECSAPGEKPCGVCPACKKVLAGIHPDVSLLHDCDHVMMGVDIARAARADAYILPNEGRRKVYLFDDGEHLPPACQDILLKVVEEGPPYAAFLFCIENPAALLPTLRSRCVELSLSPVDEGTEYAERARALCRAIAEKKSTAIVKYMVKFETAKCKTPELAALLSDARELLAAALLGKSGGNQPEIVAELAESLTKSQIMRTIDLLEKYRNECRTNVGPTQVMGALSVELEGIL